MASTRSKNTSGNYCLEQRGIQQNAAYLVNKEYAYPQRVLTAGTGLVQGYMGNAVLAENPQDVESFLFGIGATNLVTPAASPFHAQLVQHPSLTMMDRKVPLILPDPLVVQNDQRQYPMPSRPLIVRP